MTAPRGARPEDFASTDPETRRVATQQLPSLRGAGAPALLLAALADRDWRVRKEAAGVAASVEPRAEVIAALVGALSETEDVGLRNAAVEAMVEIGRDAVGPAAAALAVLDADGRKLAVEILGGICDAPAVLALIGALRDADPNVRATGAEALGNARAAGDDACGAAAAALTSALRDDATLVKLAALDSLVRLDARVPWATLEEFLSQPMLRRQALAAAGRSEEDAAVLALAAAAGEVSRGVASAAIGALAENLGARPRSSEVLAGARARINASPRALGTTHSLARDGDDPGARGAALVVLGLLGDARDVAELVAGLEDPELAPRAEAGLRLFGAAAVAPALEAGRASVAPVRAATLSLVPLMSDPPGPYALAALREALGDANDAVIAAAMNALASTGTAEDLVTVAKLATSPDARLAGTACSALATLAARYPTRARQLAAGVDPSGTDAVVGCVLLGAIAALGSEAGARGVRPSEVAYLRAALDHRDVRVRRAAVDALAALGDREAGEAVAVALADEQEDVVLAAVRALGRMGCAAPLLTLLRTTKDPGVVSSTLLALREASPDDAYDASRPLLSRSDPALACAAVEALGSLRGPRRDDALRLALEHPVAEVVTSALVELARTSGDEARSSLAFGLDHGSPEVRRVAAELLGADGSTAAQSRLRARLEREPEARVREAIAVALTSRSSVRSEGT